MNAATVITEADIRARLDRLTKPPGSLGRLEDLALRLCEIQQTLEPQTSPRRLVLFAADHGVVASGVSAWPAAVTGLMVNNMRAGGAASTVFARESATVVVLVNVGTLDEPDAPAAIDSRVIYRSRRVAGGTRDLAHEPAMTAARFDAAWEIGVHEARDAAAAGCRVVVGGEMGIGNTTSAACLAVLLADVPVEHAVGRGAGADDATLGRKREIVARAVGRARLLMDRDSLTGIASVCGFEIAAMAGFFTAAHSAGLTIVVDGVIAAAAALIAERLVPDVRHSMIAAHRSVEPAHGPMLDRLGLSPFLEWQMRLGEGTGALLLLPLMDAAAAMISRMATLDDLSVGDSQR